MARNPKAKYEITAEDKTAAAWRSAMRNADNSGKKISGFMKAAFAGVSVSAITQAISKSFELGDEIGKLAVKAGVGAKEISELSHAAKMFDVDIGALATSIRKMQIATSEAASGNKQYRETFAALGVDLSTFRKLSADSQFEAIADAIASIRDPADRARAATELFGKAGADLLPMFEKGAQGIREAREEAIALGTSFSEEQVRLLQEGDDAIKRLSAAWDGWMAKLAVGTVKFAQAIDLIDKDRVGELQDQLESVRFELQQAVAPPEGSPFNPELYQRLALEAQALERQIQSLQDTYTRGGGSRRGAGDQNAPGFSAPPVVEPLKRINQYDSLWQEFEENAADLEFAEQMMESRIEGMREARDDLMTMVERGIDEGVKETADRALDSIQQVGDAMEHAIEKQGEMSVYAEEAARNMQSHFADFLFDPFDEGLEGMAKGFIDVIRRMLAEAAAAKVFETLFGGKSGAGGSGSGGLVAGATMLDKIWGVFGGMKAEGGPLEQGKWYVAGEKGPEPIWGGGSGAFAMGYGGGGSVTVVNNNHFHNMRDVTDAKMSVWANRISDATVARVRDDRRRGK